MIVTLKNYLRCNEILFIFSIIPIIIQLQKLSEPSDITSLKPIHHIISKTVS